MFASNDKQEAISVAKDSGFGVSVIKQNDKEGGEKIIFISPFQSDLTFLERIQISLAIPKSKVGS